MRPICCLETSVMKYHYSLRNNPEKRSSHLLRGGSSKSRKVMHVTAMPAYSSKETVQIHDLTTPFHSKTDNSVLQISTFGKITSFRRGKFTVGRKNQFPVRGRKEWRRKTRPNTHENKQRATVHSTECRDITNMVTTTLSHTHSVHATLGMRV